MFVAAIFLKQDLIWLKLTGFILVMVHSSGINLGKQLTLSDNPSVYKYGQPDGTSIQTGIMDDTSKRRIRLFALIYAHTIMRGATVLSPRWMVHR